MPQSVVKQLVTPDIPFPWVVGYTLAEGQRPVCLFFSQEEAADALMAEFNLNQTITLDKGTPAEQLIRPEYVCKMTLVEQLYKLSY